jgi:hypothetical protein
MAIIELKGWYLADYEPIAEVIKRPHDLRLNKSSLLKSGLRADFLNEIEAVRGSVWFQRYLEGEKVEFYMEGSGGYAIANIDLISREIYFSKQEVSSLLEPLIFLSCQNEYPPSSEALVNGLTEAVAQLNRDSRVPLSLEIAQRPTDNPTRLGNLPLRQIRKSLLFIADTTPIARGGGERPKLISSPLVCLELGYAQSSKKTNQILLVSQERSELRGEFPFDLPEHQQLTFKDESELTKTLPTIIKTLLARFNLFS